jgi:HEAT repeat protein
VHALTSILETANDEGLVTLLCQALGQSEQATAIDALARVLAEHKVFFFGRRWGAEVRGTAALALLQIPHPMAGEVLARYESDGNPEVRQAARSRGAPDRGARLSRTSGALRQIADLPPES